jgi:hypothetical protein
MRRFFAAGALTAALLLSGCFFDNPLTSGPTEDLNTWLLGVWEHKDAKGQVYRAGVLPLTRDRMTVWFRKLGKTPREMRQWEFEAWLSRVGSVVYLNLKCLSSAGEVPEGAFVFVQHQVVNQNAVNIRKIELTATPDTTSFQLRAEVRARYKDGSLFPDAPTRWNRISEVYWEVGDIAGEQPFQPLRYPPAASTAVDLEVPETESGLPNTTNPLQRGQP